MPRNPAVKALMNSRNPRTRQLGRKLARGSSRHNLLDLAIQIAGRVAKDGDGGPMVAADIATPTAGGRRKARRG